MAALVKAEGLEGQVELDSAGTGAWHVGESPDSRSREVAARRGYRLVGAARRFTAEDFDNFDYLLAMDASNLENMRALARSEQEKSKAVLFRSFDPKAPRIAEVPDPYYGGPDGFDRVLDMCESAAKGLIGHLRSTGQLAGQTTEQPG